MIPLIEELKSLLSTSDSKLRKHWAQRVVQEAIPVNSLLSLLHAELKTAQRFAWFIGDLLEADPDLVKDCLPLLFSLRDQMPFPGMQRTVGKCFFYCGVPHEFEQEIIPVLFEWLKGDQHEVSIKHYAAKVLFQLAKQSRIDVHKLNKILQRQEKHTNSAHASRMSKLRGQLTKLIQK